MVFANEFLIQDKFDFDFCPIMLDLMPINLDEICHNPKDFSVSPINSWMRKYFDISNDLTQTWEASDPSISVSKKLKRASSIRPKVLNKDDIYHFRAFILSKSMNTVSGKAFQCKKMIYTRTWSKNVWGTEYRNDEVRTEILDSDSCWYLVNNNKCSYGSTVNNMTCDENQNCNFEGTIKDEYSWMQDVIKSFAHCYVSPKFISESDLNSHIFNGICKVADWSCRLHDSIIVWHRDVVQTCPFKLISDSYIFTSGPHFLDKKQKLGFQFKSIESHCNVDMIRTTEGLYMG